MLNRLSQQIRSIFSRPTRRRRASFRSSECLEPRELLTTVVELVEDLNQQPAGIEIYETEIHEVGNLHFFTAHTLEFGTELWRTDGTEEGTIRLTDLKAEPENRFCVRGLTTFHGDVYFIAQDNIHGEALWKSNGTVEGTVIVADMDPAGPFESMGRIPVVAGDTIWFTSHTAASGDQVYRLDYATGTIIAVTNFSNLESYYISDLTAADDLVYLTRYSSQTFSEIWRTGSTAVEPELMMTLPQGSNITNYFAIGSTLLITEVAANVDRVWSIDPSGDISEVTNLPGGDGRLFFSNGVVHRGKLFLPFSRSTDQLTFNGLWVTDGTNEQSIQLGNRQVYSTTVLNDTVYFLSDGELWMTDGTLPGTMPSGVSTAFSSLISKSDRLFLLGYDQSLWISDGTSAATRMINFPGSRAVLPSQNSTLADSGLVFWAEDQVHGRELWISDGDHSTARMLKDLREGTENSSPYQVVPMNGDLFVSTTNGPTYRIRHSHPILEIRPNDFSSTFQLTLGDSVVYLVTQGGGTSIVQFDQSGFRNVKTFSTSYVTFLGTYGDGAFFVISSGPDVGLWYTNGTEAGTIKLKSFATNIISQFSLDEVTGDLWFDANDGIHGYELWTSDGTMEGTKLVRDISEGANGPNIGYIYAHEGDVYFTIKGIAWVSDGTPTGTGRLESVENALGIQLTESFAAFKDAIFMSVLTTARGWEVVRTQGTAETSRFVTNLSQSDTPFANAPFYLTPFGDQLAFAAQDGDGLGLWVSDDMEATRLRSFGTDVSIENWSIAGETLFFTVNNRVTTKQEIWASDGTVEGTRKLRHDAFDVLYVPKYATFVEYAGGIAFAAGTVPYGIELFRIDTTVAPEAPTNLSVMPRASSSSNSIHVEWDEMPGANDYEIQFLNTTTQAIVVQEMLDIDQFDSEALPVGAYRLMVRSRSVTGDLSDWAQSASFAIGHPVMNSVATSASATRTFQWASPLGSLSTEVWLTNRDAGTRVLYQTGVTGNSLATPSPLSPARYAVWVRSKLPGGQVTDWSAAVEFDVLAPAPTLISGSGTSNDGLPVISWTAVPGAASYQVQIHPVGSNTPLLSVSGLTATTYRVPQPMAGGRYLISIRAMKGTRQFAVPLLNQPLFVRRAPAGLKAEVNGFSWSASPGALTYGYEIRNVRTNAVVMQGSQTSTIAQRSTAFPPGQYQARVFATYSGGVNTQWSAPLVFEEFRPALTITSPWTPTADATPGVTWTAGIGVTTYEVQAFRQGSGTISYSAIGVTTTSHRIANALTAGTYVIQVRANYADGSRSAWSDVRTRVIGPAPVLTQTSRTIAWSSVPDATHYEFWVNYLGPNAPITKVVYVPALAQTQYTLPSILPKGRYQVWVRAIRAENGELYAGLWGSNGAFEIS